MQLNKKTIKRAESVHDIYTLESAGQEILVLITSALHSGYNKGWKNLGFWRSFMVFLGF